MKSSCCRALECGLVAVFCAFLGGCFGAWESADVVARVGEDAVEFADFAAFTLAGAGESWEVLEEEVLVRLFRQFLDELLFLRLARDRGLVGRTATRQDALLALHSQIDVDSVGDAEIREFLRTHPAELLRPERLVLGQLLVQQRAVAEDILERLRSGEDFAELGARLADSSDVVFGGYTKDVSPQDLVPPFRDVLFSLSAGEVSGIVEAEYGFHIFHVRERHPEAPLSWEEAVPLVSERLQRELADGALDDMLQEARGLYAVEVLAGNLPFLWDVEEDS